MPNLEARRNIVDTAGAGHQGFCSICAVKDKDVLKAFNKQMNAGAFAPALKKWMGEKTGWFPDRLTIRDHKRHMSDPRDRIVTAVQASQARGLMPRRSTAGEFVDAIEAIAHQKAMDNPDLVTIDHGLRAAQIKQQVRASDRTVLLELAKLMTRKAPVDVTPVEYPD